MQMLVPLEKTIHVTAFSSIDNSYKYCNGNYGATQ